MVGLAATYDSDDSAQHARAVGDAVRAPGSRVTVGDVSRKPEVLAQAGNATGKPELLAPAGGWSQLKAAIRFGADAVYLACDKFGMRARADNFHLEEMPQVVAYAHERGVAVHVTLNTLMDARDIAELPAYFRALAQAGADAFIIGDLGAFMLAREHAPSVELHVSTQASVMNAAAARAWYDLGATRVVCAREMSVADIAQMRADTPPDLQIEAFVHGAMCVAYSGRCLLSSAMTGRSGNKGACAQSCRWSYALVEEQRPGEYFEVEEDVRGSFVLNAQDLNMVAHLDELAAAGVDSFKIEGRNKQAFYVATVVGAYRSVLDGGDVAAAERELLTISHRPYSTGFYYGRATQTPERDGYVKECLHVATVEECAPAPADELAAGTGSDAEIGNESADPAPAAALGHAPAPAVPAPADEPADPRQNWRVTALCHNRFARGDELEVVSPHKPVRSFTVGPLVRLAPADGGKPFVERGDLPLDEVRALSYEQPEEVANRSKEHYLFEVPFALEPGDYLRRRV